MTHILVACDEPRTLESLQNNLRACLFTVDTVADGRQALLEAIENPPDAVILDLGLPQIEGHNVIQALRGWSPVPIIALSGRSEVEEKVAALDAGADDYITTPFSMTELLARLRAILRRPSVPEPSPPDVAHIGAWTIDPSRFTARREDGTGDSLRLTPTEWSILGILLRHPGKLLTSQEILRQARGEEHESKTNYLRVYFSSLRRKLEPDPASPRHLLTEPRRGYRFQP